MPKILRKKNWVLPYMPLLLSVCGSASNRTRACNKLAECHTYDAFILGIYKIESAFHGRKSDGITTHLHLKEFKRRLCEQSDLAPVAPLAC